MLLLAGGLVAFSFWVESAAIAPEPVLASVPRICDQLVYEQPAGVSRIAGSWSRVHRGVRFMKLQGEPFELGFANGKLSGDAPEKLEDVLYRAKDAFIPSKAAQWAVRKLVLFKQRNLASFIPEARQLEILGLTRAARRDRHSEDGPLYNRVLGYHAVHDVAHMLIDNPLIHGHYDELKAGCTAFAASKPATKDGHVLLARNFDFEAGRVFDEEKVVIACLPSKGIPFVHVAWSGMVGAVTGINAEGIACALNAGASDDDASCGRPVSLVVRDVLEQARTLDEAVAIIRAAPVFVSDSYVLASGREERTLVVEKSPGRCAVREAKEGLLLVANHFLTPEFANDETNGRRRHDATTEERLGRLDELTAPLRGHLDAKSALAILRDRRGPKGKDVGLGNRGAIDGLIATHSVIIDATDRVLWVSVAPHTLGHYLRVPLDAMLRDASWAPSDEGAFPEDPLVASGEYEKHLTKRRKLLAARDALSAGDLARAKALAEEARLLDARFYEPEELLARIARESGDAAAAKEHAKAALDRVPPFATLRDELEALAR